MNDFSGSHAPEATAPETRFVPLDPLEIHSGMIVGRRRSPAPPTPQVSESLTILEAMGELLLPALAQNPCLVAFSGGRDSSAMLATAVLIARTHGLPDPVPITFRFDQHQDTWENDWQDQVIRHLGLADWKIVSADSEVDVLGATTREILRRHGLFWPANAHTIVRLMRAAVGGALITGNGGDEMFNSLVRFKEMTVRQMFRHLPLWRALVSVPVSQLPHRFKVRIQYIHGLRFPWLRSRARREVIRRFVKSSMEKKRDERHYLETFVESRYYELICGTFETLSRTEGVYLCEPFLDSRLHAAVLRHLPTEAFPSRNAALQAFFGDLLPTTVARRTTKAVFTTAFWGAHARDFARRWDGTGLDASLVDPEKLREEWARPRPDGRAAIALHAAWLATEGGVWPPSWVDFKQNSYPKDTSGR